MRKIKWWLDTGFAGCEHKGSFEIDDNATAEEIEAEVREHAFGHLDWGWVEE